MANRHIIEDTVFDVEFFPGHMSFEEDSRLNDEAKFRLLSIIEGVFDRFSLEDRVIRLDRLDIDLGIVDYSSYQTTMESRLGERLELALQEALSSHLTPADPGSIGMTQAEADCAHLEHFLATGRLSWNGALRDDRAIDSIWTRVVQDHPEEVIRWLTRSPVREVMVDRILHQFSEPQLHPLIAHLAIEDDQDGDLLLHAMRSSAILHGLLERFPSLQTPASSQNVRRSSDEPPQALTHSQAQTSPHSPTRHPSGPDPEISALEDLFRKALAGGSIEPFLEQWNRLLRARSDALVHWLYQICGTARIRRFMSTNFPVPFLHDLLQLLVPSEKPFILAVLASLDAIWALPEEGQKGATRLPQRFWYATLTYLCLDPKRPFRPTNFLLDVLREMDSPSPICGNPSSPSLPSLLQRLDLSPADRQDLLAKLPDHRFPFTASAQELEHVEIETRSLLDQVDQIDELFELLRPGPRLTPAEEQRLCQLFGGATDQKVYPILKVFRALQTGNLPFKPMVERLTTRELEALLKSLLGLIGQTSGQPPADLANAIAGFAERAGDRKRYFSRVLSCLVSEEVLDFEALTQPPRPAARRDTRPEPSHQSLPLEDRSGESPVTSSPSGLEPGNPPKNRDAPLSGSEAADDDPLTFSDHWVDLEPFLIASFRNTGKPSAEEIRRLCVVWEQAITRHAHRLGPSLAHLLEEAPMPPFLLEAMPERVLARMLALLQPQDFPTVQRYADLLTDACTTLPGRPPADLLRQLKWQFVFHYFFQKGWPFTPRRFVLLYLEYLTTNLGLPDRKDCARQLAHQITADILPSTAPRAQALVELLEEIARGQFDPLQPHPNQPFSGKLAFTLEKSLPGEVGERVYVANAGLVLAGPYLPQLFRRLHLLEGSGFTNPHSAERAVHLLQYMVDERTNAPEFQLSLNKILCGVPLSMPITREIRITPGESAMIEGLIQGMIGNWPAIGQTSVAGFRECFFQRDGKIERKAEAWHLRIEARPFDMLLDRLPWSYSPITFPWMEGVLHVHWRS